LIPERLAPVPNDVRLRCARVKMGALDDTSTAPGSALGR